MKNKKFVDDESAVADPEFASFLANLGRRRTGSEKGCHGIGLSDENKECGAYGFENGQVFETKKLPARPRAKAKAKGSDDEIKIFFR